MKLTLGSAQFVFVKVTVPSLFNTNLSGDGKNDFIPVSRGSATSNKSISSTYPLYLAWPPVFDPIITVLLFFGYIRDSPSDKYILGFINFLLLAILLGITPCISVM